MTNDAIMWMCTKCWHILPKSKVEDHPPTSASVCPQCAEVGSFVTHKTGEFAAMANDLLFEAYAHKIRAAGYPIVSMPCGVDAHDKCTGRAEDNEPCDCDCHSAASHQLERTRTMKIDTREIDGVLILDISGVFPERYQDDKDIEDGFRDMLAGCDKFAVVLDTIKSLEPKHLVFLLRWIQEAGYPIAGLGLGPNIRIVTDREFVRDMFDIVDSSVRVYSTVEDALAASA